MKNKPGQGTEGGNTAEPKRRKSGAGVKAENGVGSMERKQVRLDESTIAILDQIGGGNLSLGIREAARRIKEHGDTGAFDEKRHLARKKGIG